MDTTTKTAKRESLGRDLFWRLGYFLWDGATHTYEVVKWTGYDDGNWWANVATTERFQVKTGEKTGKTYRLDPQTGVVTITDAEVTA